MGVPKISFLYLTLCFLVINRSDAQTLNVIAIIEKEHQDCLDKGENMVGCSVWYYGQMDSLLNIAYNNLRKRVAQREKDILKGEEIDWLKKRDKYFKIVLKKSKKEFGDGEDGYMIAYDEEGDFIKQRTIELIKRLNKLSN